MIFIVAASWKCASIIGRREGLTHSQWTAWTQVRPAGYRIRGTEDPQIWIADCGLETLTEDDKDMIASRYRTPGAGPSRVTCDG